jgi:transposase
LAAIVRDETDQRLPATARVALMILVRQIEIVNTEIAALDTALRKENKASELGPRLETIPSVGPVIASAFRARVTDPKLFKNGRHLSAWIGTVPENDSTLCRARHRVDYTERRTTPSVLRAWVCAQCLQSSVRKSPQAQVGIVLFTMPRGNRAGGRSA